MNTNWTYDPDMPIDAVMRRWPATMEVMMRHRMLCIGCPIGGFSYDCRGMRGTWARLRTRSSANWRWPFAGAREVIEEADIERLVRTFYERAREDEVLGAHLCGPCRGTGRIICSGSAISGRPSSTGRGVIRVGRCPPMFRSVSRRSTSIAGCQLFEETARDVCSPEAAGVFMERARLIAGSLELAIASHDGVIVPRGGRLPGKPTR